MVSSHFTVRLRYCEHTTFSIYISLKGYYEHYAHNKLKQDAQITPVEGVVKSLMGSITC